MMTFIEKFNAARDAGAPLVAVRTADQKATLKTIFMDAENKDCPKLIWDINLGLSAGHKDYESIVAEIRAQMKTTSVLKNPVEMMVAVMRFAPKDTIVFAYNLHRQFGPEVNQAIWSLRDTFKMNKRTLVLLCPNLTLPQEIVHDVLVLDEPLPDNAQLEKIVCDTYEIVNVPKPKPEFLARAVDALCGLAAFPAEQVCAMSIHSTGLDIEQLQERKRQQIEQVPGLSVWRGKEKFSDIGGCENSKEFLTSVMNGEDRPRAIVFQDEIEKSFGGAATDLSGVTQELLGYQLSFMQDHNSTGLMFIGHPGCTKSLISKAAGNESCIPTIQFDLGGMKGSLVGESNANMRMALKVVEAVSQGRALWIATSNNIANLPPELRRRYSFGTFFFDLPNNEEREVIWNIYFNKFKLKDRDKPSDIGWTGAEIRNCCDIAWRLKIPLKDAAAYIVPMYKQSRERIVELQKEADGRYISAGKPGVYKAPEGIDDDQPETTVVAVGVVEKRKIKTPKENKGNVN